MGTLCPYSSDELHVIHRVLEEIMSFARTLHQFYPLMHADGAIQHSVRVVEGVARSCGLSQRGSTAIYRKWISHRLGMATRQKALPSTRNAREHRELRVVIDLKSGMEGVDRAPAIFQPVVLQIARHVMQRLGFGAAADRFGKSVVSAVREGVAIDDEERPSHALTG